MACPPTLQRQISEGRWSDIQPPRSRPEYVIVDGNPTDFDEWFIEHVMASGEDAWAVYRAFFRPNEMAWHASYFPMPMLEYLKEDLLKATYWTMFYMTYRKGYEAMDWFLGEGADINEIYTTFYGGSIASSNMLLLSFVKNYVDYLFGHSEGDEKQLTMIRNLLERGADPLLENRLGVSALGWLRGVSLSGDRKAAVQRLIELVERWA
jgi:hypothetical protein